MRIKRDKLKKIIKEELEAVIITLPDSSATSLVPFLKKYLGSIRAFSMWSHSAHHLTKGAGFIGDHIHLYGDIYESLTEEYDKAAEKFISLTDDEGVACPHSVLKEAIVCLENFESPVNQSADEIAKTALEVVKKHKTCIEDLFSTLEENNSLSLGMDDFLCSSHDTHEKYCYLLKQRLKK